MVPGPRPRDHPQDHPGHGHGQGGLLKPVPLFDLRLQYRRLGPALRKAVTRALDSGAYILGPEGRLFEKEFARVLGLGEVIGVDSGTSALELGLKALGVGPGDEVVVPAFTFIATATAVSAVGAKPVFCDVDPKTLTMGAAQAASALTKRTKALVPVHLYGAPADMDPLLTLARRRGLKVLEDCAQAHLTSYKGRPAGTLGDIAAFSFYPSKNLGAAGDAGAIATGEPKLAEACRALRNAGRGPGAQYDHRLVGHNCRLDDLQAAILRVKLGHLRDWTRRRRAIAAIYNKGLSGLPLVLPDPGSAKSRHSFHLYVVRSPERDALARHLKEAGIATAVYYPLALHLQPAYRRLGHKSGDFPESERASREVLALPMFPELAPAQAEKVCKAARSFFGL